MSVRSNDFKINTQIYPIRLNRDQPFFLTQHQFGTKALQPIEVLPCLSQSGIKSSRHCIVPLLFHQWVIQFFLVNGSASLHVDSKCMPLHAEYSAHKQGGIVWHGTDQDCRDLYCISGLCDKHHFFVQMLCEVAKYNL